MGLKLEEQYDKIYAFCYFKVRNADAAEDITQEAFLKYFEAEQYLERGKRLAYLYTIARNCCADYFRQSRRTVSLDAMQWPDGEGAAPAGADAAGADIETLLAVRAAVHTLTQQEQELVLLRYTAGLSLGEIAEYLGISRFALYRRLKAAEKKLLRKLPKEDFYE